MCRDRFYKSVVTWWEVLVPSNLFEFLFQVEAWLATGSGFGATLIWGHLLPDPFDCIIGTFGDIEIAILIFVKGFCRGNISHDGFGQGCKDSLVHKSDLVEPNEYE